MPCYTERYTTIDASKYHLDTLKTALEEMGFRVRHDAVTNSLGITSANGRQFGLFRGGRIEAPTGMLDETTLAREYSRARILTSAKTRGWTVKQTSRYKLEVTKKR